MSRADLAALICAVCLLGCGACVAKCLAIRRAMATRLRAFNDAADDAELQVAESERPGR